MRASSVLALLVLGGAVALVVPRSERRIDAGTAVRLDVPDLVDRADLALEGRVVERHVAQDGRGRIETSYALAVERTFWGEPRAIRSVRLPGGVLPDGRGMILPGMPDLAVGEDVLLFLSPPGDTGIRMPIGLAQGKLRVVTGLSGERFLVRAQADLNLVDPRYGTVHRAGGRALLDYARTIARIRAAVEARKARVAAGEEG